MNTFRRLALLLALLLAVLPAHAQSSKKKSSRRKPATTKVVKKKPIKKKKGSAADPSTQDATSSEPMVFGEPDAAPEPTPSPQPKPAPGPKPVAVTPVREEPKPELRPTVSNGAVALFAVARTPGASDAAMRMEGELMRHLRAGGAELVDMSTVFPPPAPVALTKADALFEEGRSAYDNLDPEAAETKLRAAAEAYTQSPAALSPERLGQTYLFLGASRMLNGDMPGAKDAFMRAVVADPEAQPDAALFSQEVQKAYEEARAEAAARPQGTLVVESQPAGAQVLVRGQELGVTPLKGVRVPAGEHPVVVQLPGYAAFGRYTDVKPGATAELKATLEATPGLAVIRDNAARASTEDAFDEDEVPAEARAIGQRLDARYVVLAAVTQTKKGRIESELQAWDLRSKARLRGVEIELGGKKSPAAAADQVLTFIQGPGLKPGKRGEDPRVAQTSGGSSLSSGSGDAFFKRPWFWAVVGGAAAVTAGAVYVTTQDGGRPWNPVNGGVGF
ncbi:MAG TPA: PEGA domain-containing protein [Myxococcus sp.]|nr:PEGA domain-containing protein [Myxococcus sp.]